MQRHNDTIKPLPETQERGTQDHLACQYRYRLTEANYPAFHAGKCDVCDEHADPLYLQIEERHYITPEGYRGMTFSGCKSLYGHKECLITARREPVDHRWENLAKGLTGDGG